MLHPDGQECPKVGEEGRAEDRPSPPAIMGKTKDDTIRPDENDFAKEMRLSAKIMEENGCLSPSDRRYFKDQIEQYKSMPGKRLWKDREIPFVIPKEFRRKRLHKGGF